LIFSNYLFEISKTDLAGRIGTIYTNHGKIETPAFVPVIHPVNNNTIKKIKEIGLMLLLQCIHTKKIMVMKQ